MRKLSATAAFSLVEVTLALGIGAFCLIAVVGLMPVGVQTNRNATSQTTATNIMAAVVADLRATPKTCTNSRQFGIQFGASTTLYFDGQGQPSCDSAGLQKYQLNSNPTNCLGSCSGSWTPPLQLRYQLNLAWNTSNPTGTCSVAVPCADLRVTWPAAATATNASGSTRMFAAFDRN
jgi:uncharacterized protein (TIGR02598 family)